MENTVEKQEWKTRTENKNKKARVKQEWNKNETRMENKIKK